MRFYYRIGWLALKLFMILYCRMKVYGAENVPKNGGVIIASNHIAGGDPPFVGSAINRELYFLAKKELFGNFLLRILIRSFNSIPVDRGVFDRSALDRAEAVLNGGFGLIVFPEGTRSKTGQLGKGKPGIGLLARKAMVPIVPAFIENSKGFLTIPFSLKRLKVHFGAPIQPQFLAQIPDDTEGYRLVVKEVMDRIEALKTGRGADRKA